MIEKQPLFYCGKFDCLTFTFTTLQLPSAHFRALFRTIGFQDVNGLIVHAYTMSQSLEFNLYIMFKKRWVAQQKEDQG